MRKEAYVTIDTAKLLKEKGFGWRCNRYYDGEDYFVTAAPANWNDDTETVSIPTHQMALAWLREKGFHINVSISYDYSVDADENVVDKWTFWLFKILSSFSGNLIYTEEVNEYDSYEEAVEAALKYCLENLI